MSESSEEARNRRRRSRKPPKKEFSRPIWALALLLFVLGLTVRLTHEYHGRGDVATVTGPAADSAGTVFIGLAIALVVLAVMTSPEK